MTPQGQRTKRQIRFFNVSLVNANLMSVPRFGQPQLLVGELIRAIEAASPNFAWVQILFRRANLSSAFTDLKNAIDAAADEIKHPKISLMDMHEYDRPELHRDWFSKSEERMKRINAIVNKPHVLVAIQGMWVGDPNSLSSLPFEHCHDEHDRLGIFTYRNPRMLVELVERRMVEDVSHYFASYTKSRLEPPSFVITPEEIPYYIHLPVAENTHSLRSIQWKQHSAEVREGAVEGAESRKEAASSKVLRLQKVPILSEPLKDKQMERLALLASSGVRGFEILYDKNRTDILLSSESELDMPAYRGIIESVYGELNVEGSEERPQFLKEIPEIVGFHSVASL